MTREVQLYIESVADGRRGLFERLQAMVLGLYPEAAATISYQIPKYKAGSGWVSLGYWKEGVSVYTDDFQAIARFKERHPRMKTGKGSINIRTTDEIPMEDLEHVVRHAMERLRPDGQDA